MLRTLLIGGLLVSVAAPAAADPAATARAKKFVAAHVEKVRPLEVASNKAWWDANISGKDEDFKKKEEAQNRVDAALADKEAFAELKAIREAKDNGGIDDPVLARTVQVLYL